MGEIATKRDIKKIKTSLRENLKKANENYAIKKSKLKHLSRKNK